MNKYTVIALLIGVISFSVDTQVHALKLVRPPFKKYVLNNKLSDVDQIFIKTTIKNLA